MHASAKLHHPTVCFDGPVPGHLVVAVTGDEGDRIRPKLGLVFVIDLSGSMAWSNKLSTVTTSLRYLSTYLTKDDCVALVSFNGAVSVNQYSVKANDKGLEEFSRALGQLIPSGGTNLDQGLTTGLAIANQMARETPSRVVRVILLTDGQTNDGQCDPAMISGRMDSASDGVGLSTIGVGEDCDHNLLGLLAERGFGSYGFVEGSVQAAEVLGTEIGGLVNLDASKVEVVVESRETYLVIAGALGVPCARDAQGRFVVKLGNLVAGQTRTLVFPVTSLPPKRTFARPVTVAEVTVRGRVEEVEVELDAIKPKIHFVSGATVRDATLDVAVDLAILAVAQRDAERSAQRRDFAEARRIMTRVSSVVGDAGVSVFVMNMVESYANVENYHTDQVLRNSMSSMISPIASLIGSTSEFNSLASRTVGSYTTSTQREVGLDAAATVSRVMGTSGSAQDTRCKYSTGETLTQSSEMSGSTDCGVQNTSVSPGGTVVLNPKGVTVSQDTSVSPGGTVVLNPKGVTVSQDTGPDTLAEGCPTSEQEHQVLYARVEE